MDARSPVAATVCLLTPLGQGGLAAVRIFGAAAPELAGRLFRPDREGGLPEAADRLLLGRVSDPAGGETIDRAILRVLPGGLGVELTLHGGVRVVQRVVSACGALGARRLDRSRPADRGELWRQAFLLARAGGVERPALWADVELALPQARTRLAADWLVGQWSRGLGREIHSLVEEVRKGKPVDGPLEGLLGGYPAWQRAIAGVRVVIVGPVNAGKSTLLNALAGQQVALVSEQPGTTRDYTARWVNLNGVAAELTDTAGLRGGQGPLEAQAVDLAGPVVREADLRLVLLDGARRPTAEELAAVAQAASIEPAVAVVNKTDLPAGWDGGVAAAGLGAGPGGPLRISAKTGAGLAELAEVICGRLGLPRLDVATAGLFADRQARLIRAALQAGTSAERELLLANVIDGDQE